MEDRATIHSQAATALSKRISFASVETKKAAQKSKSLITYIEKTGSLYYNPNGAKVGFSSGGLFAVTNGLALTAKDFSVI